jgi:DNA-binding winged helix-turn-helix (wHTH) protein/tetratricopeptide (TPR) repeat protein
MRKSRCLAFGPFRLDLLDERLWKHDASVPLGHKAFAVLTQLIGHANQLVTKEELLSRVWPDTAVSEAVLTTAMRQIRVALDDAARTPQVIQTVHGRGYRFIQPVSEIDDLAPARIATASGGRETLASPTWASPDDDGIVGRETELRQLWEWYGGIQQGARRVGLIAGEAGIGKTALVDAFLTSVVSTSAVRIARGQCVEQYGAGEAYLPILEALGRLGRNPDVPIVQVLRRYAPSWLAHLPWLVSDAAVASARVAPERMLRELTEALEALAADQPLVLVLEDLHWSDRATLEWLASVARRRDAARLLVLGTYRPIEAGAHRSPLLDVVAELRDRPQTAEICLDHLSRGAVDAYVRQRCGGFSALDRLVEVLHRRTGGHPLFLAGIMDTLILALSTEGHAPGPDLCAMAHATPPNVRQFMERRIERLSEEDQAILEAASVAGDSFCIPAAAAGASIPDARVEARCAVWARTHRIVFADGITRWPDGTLGGRYRFRHALYHETVYARISPARRARLHLLTGNRLEGAYGRDGAAIATELAMHFEQGRDSEKAVTYLVRAGRNAVHRSAYVEAHAHLIRALKIVETFPNDEERLSRQAELLLLLAQVLETTEGWGALDVERTYARAREICTALHDEPSLLQATWGSIAVSIVRADLRRTQELSRDLLRLAKKGKHAAFRMAAHAELGGAALALGQTTSARKHFQLAEALDDPDQHRVRLAAFGMNMGVFARAWHTHVTWQLGFLDRARADAEQAIRAAAQADHPFTHTVALAYAAMLSQFLREIPELDRLTSATIAHATEHGFTYYLAWADVLQGWSRVVQGGGAPAVADIRRGIEVLERTARLRLPYYRSLLAEACGRISDVDDGLRVVDEAFDDIGQTEERWWEAELHRTRGELLRLAANDAKAEESFRIAIDIARQQRALALELRATTSLSRLWQCQGKLREARRALAGVYDCFTEGLDTPDLQDARSLLEQLAPRAARPLGRPTA